ncbi:uncharacterized RNA methyltransferase TTE1797-like [Hylaeus volcanicus]|uniref:uncharacterized RNA methyltransferase TTE1797-like n=1 Tax=Hylaeus volcanicus TaxID=313075 RepID=UPI0023B7760D|nr:uncharacterized RNA methyltransferase TTE1797-like [Hylaeus volcanicus]
MECTSSDIQANDFQEKFFSLITQKKRELTEIEKENNNLKLRISSGDLKQINFCTLLEQLKRFTSVKFLLDKPSRRNVAYAYFKYENDVETFYENVNGQVINSEALHLEKWKPCNKVACRSTTISYKPYEKENERSEKINQIPCLLDLKKKRLPYWQLHDVLKKVTPLSIFSYPLQLQIKENYIKTCIKSLTRQMLQILYPELCYSKSLKKTLPQVAYGKEIWQDQLNWCVPSVCKGFLGCPVTTIIPSPKVIGYRNKCEFTIGFDSENVSANHVNVGFVKSTINYNPIVQSCSGILTVPYCMQELCHRLKIFIHNNLDSLPVYCRRTHKGFWRLCMIRVSEEFREMLLVVQIASIKEMIAFIDTKDDKKETLIASSENEFRSVQQFYDFFVAKLISFLITQKEKTLQDSVQLYDNYKITSLYIQQRSNCSDAFESSDPLDLVYGKPYLTFSLLQCHFRVTPLSFFQTNTQSCCELYTQVFEFVQKTKASLVLDVCSGVGTISICLSSLLTKQRSTIRFRGVELEPSAVQDAITNLSLNAIHNAHYNCGKAEDILPNLLQDVSKDDTITALVDPPRQGLHSNVISTLLQCEQIQSIIYISCNPESFLHDARKLCTPTLSTLSVFKPTQVTCVDMFPHTYHCEMVCLLERIPLNETT